MQGAQVARAILQRAVQQVPQVVGVLRRPPVLRIRDVAQDDLRVLLQHRQEPGGHPVGAAIQAIGQGGRVADHVQMRPQQRLIILIQKKDYSQPEHQKIPSPSERLFAAEDAGPAIVFKARMVVGPLHVTQR